MLTHYPRVLWKILMAYMAGTETTVTQMHKMDGYSSKRKKKKMHKMVHPKLKSSSYHQI